MSIVKVAEVFPASVDTVDATTVSVNGRIIIDGSGWPEGAVKHFIVETTFEPGQLLVVLNNNSLSGIVAGQLAGPTTEEVQPSRLNVSLASGTKLVMLGA